MPSHVFPFLYRAVARESDNSYHLQMLRLTAQRQAILDFINASNRHWDAEELARAMAEAGQQIGIATVYRGLAALDTAGLISSVQLADKKRYERANKSHHDHLICNECGAIREFSQPQIEQLQKSVAAEKGFEMSGHQLVIFGTCPDCQSSQSSEA